MDRLHFSKVKAALLAAGENRQGFHKGRQGESDKIFGVGHEASFGNLQDLISLFKIQAVQIKLSQNRIPVLILFVLPGFLKCRIADTPWEDKGVQIQLGILVDGNGRPEFPVNRLSYTDMVQAGP